MELETLRDLYIEGLKDLYSAENQIIKAMPKMIKKASHPELKRAFTQHLRETERQATRLERICRDLGESPKGKKCVGMEGLIEEAKDLIEERPDPDVLDAGLIAAAQHVEHYEMAGYGTMRTYARQLGYDSHADMLQQTLDEEGNTDHLLTELAERSINIDAESQDDASTRRFGRTSGPAKKGARKAAAKKGGARKKAGAKRGAASKKRSTKRGASSRGALSRARSGGLRDRAKALVGG